VYPDGFSAEEIDYGEVLLKKTDFKR